VAQKRKDPSAVALGKKAAAKGAPKKAAEARWARTSKEERQEVARKLLEARWGRRRREQGT